MSTTKFLQRNEIREVFSKRQTTTHFRHLLPARKADVKKKNSIDEIPPIAKTKDRIKWWNIIPGDLVRVEGDNHSPVREVKGINKLTNEVFLESENKRKQMPDDDSIARAFGTSHPHKVTHYSRVQLFLGNYDFPPAPGETEKRSIPVYARRIAKSSPRYEKGRWVWDRFATATTPRLPTWVKGVQERIHVPWPEEKKPVYPDPTKYDTAKGAIAQVTYTPARIPTRPRSSTPTLNQAAADLYIKALRGDTQYTQDFPMELFVARELSNPHSRIKKRQRYLAARERDRALLKEYLALELKKNIKGRTKREAVAEATFRWRERLRVERKVELKRRRVLRGQDARIEKKREKRGKKIEARRRRLNELVVRAAPNQIMPKLDT